MQFGLSSVLAFKCFCWWFWFGKEEIVSDTLDFKNSLFWGFLLHVLFFFCILHFPSCLQITNCSTVSGNRTQNKAVFLLTLSIEWSLNTQWRAHTVSVKPGPQLIIRAPLPFVQNKSTSGRSENVQLQVPEKKRSLVKSFYFWSAVEEISQTEQVVQFKHLFWPQPFEHEVPEGWMCFNFSQLSCKNAI